MHELFPSGEWFSEAGLRQASESGERPLIEVVLGDGIARDMGKDQPNVVGRLRDDAKSHHALVQPWEGEKLEDLLGSVKKWASRRIHEQVGHRGLPLPQDHDPFWPLHCT